MKFKDVIANVQPATIVRLIALTIALINLVLSMFGAYQLPGLTEESQEELSVIITVVISALSYWYNNSWSKNATIADKVIAILKNPDIDTDGLVAIINSMYEDSKHSSSDP